MPSTRHRTELGIPGSYAVLGIADRYRRRCSLDAGRVRWPYERVRKHWRIGIGSASLRRFGGDGPMPSESVVTRGDRNVRFCRRAPNGGWTGIPAAFQVYACRFTTYPSFLLDATERSQPPQSDDLLLLSFVQDIAHIPTKVIGRRRCPGVAFLLTADFA